jgi:uncharacterized protein (TIGR02147 family)
MIHKSIFEYDQPMDYFDYRFATFGATRGLRNQLSKNLKMKPTYVSKLLSGKSPLPLDVVPVINQLLEHTETESEFLILLVLHYQAETKALKNHFKKQINHILNQQRNDATWIKNQQSFSEEVQAEYTSQWYHPIIHVMTRIPKYQTPESIAEYLNLSRQTVTNSLNFLIRAQLVEYAQNRYQMTQNRMHIKKDSKWIGNYHHQLRQLGLQSLTETDPQHLHYSIIMSVSQADKNKIQRLIQKLLTEMEPIIESSADQELSILTLDYFDFR